MKILVGWPIGCMLDKRIELKNTFNGKYQLVHPNMLLETWFAMGHSIRYETLTESVNQYQHLIF